jgi:hypothetical protein
MPPPIPGDSIGVIGSNILHRLSPSQDLSDDLPRAGLSLNPDAKAFAFPFVQQHHSRAASVPSPIGSGAGGAPQLVRNGLSSSSLTNGGGEGGTSSALPSPTSSTYPSPISPPAKSRMEFANVSSTSTAPLSARFTPPFDWPRSTGSPKTTSATTTPTGGDLSPAAGVNASGAVGFNPFDEEDSLLGPLR